MKEVDTNDKIEGSGTDEKKTGFHRRNFKRRKRPFVVEVIYTDSASEENNVPVYKTTASAGADLKALTDVEVPAKGFALQVKTGIKMKIPYGFEGQLRPRSGLSNKGLTIINTPGTIDADYRGEIMINFVNLSDTPISLKAGDSIAQMVFAPVKHARFVTVTEFTPDKENTRGEGGFGSTDAKEEAPVVTEN